MSSVKYELSYAVHCKLTIIKLLSCLSFYCDGTVEFHCLRTAPATGGTSGERRVVPTALPPTGQSVLAAGPTTTRVWLTACKYTHIYRVESEEVSVRFLL